MCRLSRCSQEILFALSSIQFSDANLFLCTRKRNRESSISDIREKKLKETCLDPEAGAQSLSAQRCFESFCIPSLEYKAASEVVPLYLSSLSRSGILTVTLHRASGLRLPESEEGSGSDTSADRDVRERWVPHAVLEYDKFQIYAEALSSLGRRGDVFWQGQYGPFKFDVSTSSELTVYLLAKTCDAAGEFRVVLLGFIRLDPFLETGADIPEYVDVQNGSGKVRLEVSFVEKSLLPLEAGQWRVLEDLKSGDLVYVKKTDTDRSYAMVMVHNTNSLLGSELASYDHPFIAPLKFAFKSPEGLRLLSPLANGGHLFGHLQRERYFAVEKARFYAAEIVCALDYLHGKYIAAALKPENILLDPFGHISLCIPRLFGLEMQRGDRIIPGRSEYPAPELLLGHTTSQMADWWTLGIFLYKMLTGLPPFYHNDANEKQGKIIGQDLQFSMELPPAAKDILTRLLDKDPAKRLGAKEGSDVRSHAFFHGVKWHELLGKEAMHFKTSDPTTVFTVEPRDSKTSKGVERRQFQGFVYEQVDFGRFTNWEPIGRIRDKGQGHTSDQGSYTSEDDGWDVVWELVSQKFHFKNRLTNEKRTADLQVAGQRAEHDITIQGHSNPLSHGLPSQVQVKEALAAALKLGYSKQTISQILEHGVDLNIGILTYEFTPDTEIMPWPPEEVLVTPLEWAVEHDRVDLVNLFLETGADTNYAVYNIPSRPALIRAERRRNLQLIDIFVQRTRRVSSTRALSLAVEQENTAIVNTLLANGVRCDFEESDRPHPPPDRDDFGGCYFGPYIGPALAARDFNPPLVVAARLGNADLVRLLLAHGADANVGYHVLNYSRQQHKDPDLHKPIPQFSCGRVLKLAMEMRHSEIVQLLLDSGADVNLPDLSGLYSVTHVSWYQGLCISR